MSKILDMSNSQSKKIIQAASGGSISAKEFQKILGNKNAPVKSMTAAQYNKKKDTVKSNDYSFKFEIEKISDREYRFTLHGKHLSTNTVNSLSFRNKLRYKSTIKKAISDGALIYKKLLPKQPFMKVIAYPISYQSRSRDDDNLYATSKIIRDSIVNIGIVIDDKRENFVQGRTREVISKVWKIEMIVEEASDN